MSSRGVLIASDSLDSVDPAPDPIEGRKIKRDFKEGEIIKKSEWKEF